ncbi:DUF6873 family GME fold protein [Candidatus Omnitrophota bacterium]
MIIIHDGRLPVEYIRALEIKVPDAEFESLDVVYSGVYESVSCHPDIYIFQLDGNTLIHAPGVPKDLLKKLKDSGVNLIAGEDDPGVEYPKTARYNALSIGGFLFHNLEYTDPVILEEAEKRGLKLVNVPQGYTRCSCLPAGKNAIITQDAKIAEIADTHGLDTLLVSSENITLPGEERGFIGGCGARTSDGNVILLGDVNMHPDGKRIEGFLKEHSSGLIMTENMPIYDAGSLLLLETS